MPELAAHVRDVPVNQIREITEAAWGTPGAIVLSIGEPGFAVPRHILEAGMACLDRDETNYTPNAGIPALREAFAARFREHNATPVGADRVYVVDGAQQGLHFAMSLLLSPGDEILIPNPGYPTFAMTSQPAARRPRCSTRCIPSTTSSPGSRTSRNSSRRGPRC